jgi:hypothetical protein
MAGFVGDCILLAVEDATFLGVGYWVQAEMLAKTKRLQLPQILRSPFIMCTFFYLELAIGTAGKMPVESIAL